jgi:O-antigen ligase
MGVDLVTRFRRSPGASPARAVAPAVPRPQGIRLNAALAVGLYVLLWAGYNTGPWYVEDPRFPANNLQLIHGLRAFVPLLAAWFALLVMLTRLNRLLRWVIGPLGLVLLFAVVGLGSSAFVSIEPLDAMYWGGEYLSIVLVLLAIVSVEDPLADLKQVLFLNWIVDAALTLSLLGALPFLGRAGMAESDAGIVGVRAYGAVYGETLGMASTRNTGFARYAAISGIVALARVWEGKRLMRFVWAGLLGASLYALVLSNGRTEVLAFIASAFLVLASMKKKRVVFAAVGIASAALLGLVGFYDKFFRYITRTGRLDVTVVTLSGRTHTWEEGWRLFLKSPWWGFGFQADRYYLSQHMHNAFLHVFVESGILGGGAILLALLIVWLLTAKYFFLRPPRDKALISPEIPGVLMFVTISSVTESTFAYYSAAWLMSAPIFAYVLALDRHMRRSQAKAEWGRMQRGTSARPRLQPAASPDGADGARSTPG